MTGIKRQHRHPNYVGTQRNLHPMPPNSKDFIKKRGKNNYKGGGTKAKPSKKEKK